VKSAIFSDDVARLYRGAGAKAQAEAKIAKRRMVLENILKICVRGLMNFFDS
jgi:hypothetical protein